MGVEAVQARISEIHSRLAELRGPTASTAAFAVATTSTAAPTGTSGATGGSASSTAFGDQLQKLLGSAGGTGSTGASTGAAATRPRGTGASSDDLAQRVIASAKEHLGVPYLWGGTTPKGFDCSGLLQYVFKQHGVTLPRVSKDQARAGIAVSPAEARPGDLVAFDNSRSRAGIDHIGMYLGDGKWIAAPRTGDVVKIQDVDLSKAAAIRRVLPTPSAPAPSAPVSAAGLLPAQALGGADSGWAAGLPAAAQRFVPAFTAAAQVTGVDARLLASVAWSESGFQPGAVSHAGAQGLMQIMPATARGLGVDPTDPEQAVLGAARYLAENLQKFDGRTDLALAAYNAGPGAVRKHAGIPPYAETQAYVSKVLDRYTTLGGRP